MPYAPEVIFESLALGESSWDGIYEVFLVPIAAPYLVIGTCFYMLDLVECGIIIDEFIEVYPGDLWSNMF
jgi:hypothetical protein